MKSRLVIIFKYITQLGLRPLVLYAFYKLGLKTGHYKKNLPIFEYQISNIKHLFTLPSREKLLQILGNEGKASLLKEADEIVRGNVRVFGESVPLNFKANQHLRHWTDYEKKPEYLSSFLFLHQDIKYLWEPARFSFAFTLSRAYHLTQENKYAESFWKYFESFTASNPRTMGPHWMNGQEVAIRMLALVWADHVFVTAPASSVERRAALHQAITHHASRVTQTLIYARSQNNNHLITEAAAIYTAGLFFKNKKWQKLGWKWLNWSVENQIGGYGEYIQHSVNYHRLVLQTALFINLIKQDAFTRAASNSLRRATHWLFSLLDSASGLTPNLGANDGALILPLSVSVFEDYRPVVQASARAFLNTQIESGVWDEMSLWFGLPPTKKINASRDYLGDNLHGKESWAYLRASTFKSRLSHSDQLHLDLWWRGLNVAQDAGTYLYNAAPPWDNLLVTTRVHNTVSVNGKDQMTRAGRFLMLDWVNGYSKPEVVANESVHQRVKAYHRGYAHVKHERIVSVMADDSWAVEDNLSTHKHVTRTFRLHWLLPDWQWQIEKRNSTCDLFLQSPHGLLKLSVSSSQPVDQRITLIRAGEVVYGDGKAQPFDGWVSRNYGQKSPALSFALEIKASYSVSFTSDFVFPK